MVKWSCPGCQRSLKRQREVFLKHYCENVKARIVHDENIQPSQVDEGKGKQSAGSTDMDKNRLSTQCHMDSLSY